MDCNGCGEHVDQPIFREGHPYHVGCWQDIVDVEAAEETSEEMRRSWEEDVERDEC